MQLSNLTGLGAKRIQSLAKLGIFSVEDLLSFLPGTYRDMTRISWLYDINVGEYGLFKVRVTGIPVCKRIRRGFSMVCCEIEDISGRAEAVWFNQPYMAQNIKQFDELYIFGKVQLKKSRRQLVSPTIESEDEIGIVPVYRLPAKAGINQKIMRSLLRQAIEYCNAQQKDLFSKEFRTRHKLCERNFAIENIHFPDSFDALTTAKRRLCFEELLLIQLFIRMQRKENKSKAGTKLSFSSEQYAAFLQLLPFHFTNAQEKCAQEIISDVLSGNAMNRLVQGDVGSGKTVIAALAMYIAVQNGGQAALMAPTDILAAQHFEEFCRLFGRENIVYLSGNLSAKEKKECLLKIKEGSAKYIIGTHALVQEKVEYARLLLVVTDEQHRFGVAQRAKLSAKGDSPHTLVMSATPIPRTLSLILFGDLDISVIDELPPGRQKISTHIIPRNKEQDMYHYIYNAIQNGQQAFFVCPLIEESEEVQVRSAAELFDILKDGVFKNIPIALMHGRLSADERKSIMEGFVKNEIKALVSTTVIEVGVNVKNATIMVIDGAERFGLAQLHQLRGRVGRGTVKSYCFLLTDSEAKSVNERLEVLTKTNDGFVIAEKDLDLRGPGDYFGKRQSGLPESRFSYAFSNLSILKETQKVLEEEILSGKESELYDALVQYVDQKFKNEINDIIYN